MTEHHATHGDEADIHSLLERWHSGDEGALHALIRREMPWLRGRIRQRLGPALRQHGDTDDFLQEAILDILRYTPRFSAPDGATFRRVVARIVENCLRGHCEYYGRMRRDRARHVPLPSDSALDLVPTRRTGTTPSQHAMRNEEEAWLRLALDLIDPLDRDVIVMREWGKASFAEIGTKLRLTENTARMRFSRALARLSDKVAALHRGEI